MTDMKHLSPVVPVSNASAELKAKRRTAIDETYRPAQQKRSAATELKLLKAGETLFAKHGFDGTKVNDIIKESGCSIGSFYHRFGDKDGLAKVMVSRYIADATQAIGEANFSKAEHGNVRNMLSSFCNLSCEFMTTRLGVYRAAQRLAESNPEIWRDTGHLTVMLRDRVLEFLPDYLDEIEAEEPKEAMTNAVQLILMVILQTRLGAGPLFPKDDAELLTMLRDAAIGILIEAG